MRINEIFYSLQGEGRFTGTPAVFVRLSGCNLSCPFCDTLHQDGTEMSEQEIVDRVLSYPAKPKAQYNRHVVLTGGEPLLQINNKLVDLLHEHNCFVQIETNGTVMVPKGVRLDWITCSPKHETLALTQIDELKVLYQGEMSHSLLEKMAQVPCQEYRIQPCDYGNEEKNRAILQGTLDYLLAHPQWSLSLQTHKLINIQ